MNVFLPLPENLAALSVEELLAFQAEQRAKIDAVAAAPADFVTEDLTSSALLEEMTAAVESIDTAQAEIDSREPVLSPEEFAAKAAELAAAARKADDDDEPDDEPDAAADDEPVDTAKADADKAAADAIVASAAKTPAGKPARAKHAVPQDTIVEQRSLVASSGLPGFQSGDEIDPSQIASAMITARNNFGNIGDGTSSEKQPIARAGWGDLYPEDRQITGNEVVDMALIAAATDPDVIRENFEVRRSAADEGSLVATGGLCAPVTPYYQLMMISQAARPVRAALPSFAADRGGLRFAAPAALSAVTTTAVDQRTAAQDAAGGTTGAKSCLSVPCPAFSEVDVTIIYHCIQFGNLAARTFPERVTQWNNLVLAAHARLAETILLTGVDAASTQITAANLGLGAAAAFLGELATAASAIRSRHRMDSQAVLRLLLPGWSLNMLLSDTFRTQFGRFEMAVNDFIAQIRKLNVEPSFYIDGAAGKGQVYGNQGAGALLSFPSTMVWYLFPEGSFIYLDGGVLELGLVRDSVLNKTNDYQIFGESFENVAFVGVESYAVTSTLCDTGGVTAPHALICPVDYTHTS